MSYFLDAVVLKSLTTTPNSLHDVTTYDNGFIGGRTSTMYLGRLNVSTIPAYLR